MSVQEAMHAAKAAGVIRDEEGCNIFELCSKSTKHELRHTMIDIILGTDLVNQ
jgi:hypothetical protein